MREKKKLFVLLSESKSLDLVVLMKTFFQELTDVGVQISGKAEKTWKGTSSFF